MRGMAKSTHRSMDYPSNDLFMYTSGRWLYFSKADRFSYNEQIRLSERYLKFDVSALKNVAALASGCDPSEVTTFSKLSEGGFNRIFQITFQNGRCVIARLPYPLTVPKYYAVASEVATLDYLRLHGIRTPRVYAWCSTESNPVGAEYIIMEKLDGTPLGEIWYSMTQNERRSIMKQIIEWETRLTSLKFPAYGSLYYRKDLPSEENVPLPKVNEQDAGFYMGPITHYKWWLGERSTLKIDRGPWLSSTDIFWARLYREIYNYRKVSPDTHIGNLSDYVKFAPFLGFKAGTTMHRPVIRHPVFQPNNILVSNSHEIVGLIDWQHCSILPLGLAAGIPKHFQNYGDPDSEELKEPQLSPNFDSLLQSEQASMREIYRKRMIHFLYATFTRQLNEEHYNAIFDCLNIIRQRILESAGTSWEGDSTTLRIDIMCVIQSWPGFFSDFVACLPPVQYSDKDVRDTLELYTEQHDADEAMEHMRRALNADVLGWVPNSEYDAARQLAQEMKDKILEMVETDHDIIAARDNFPFDDFDEDA
ncbi:hypothetical protein BO94DRAFT_557614 [Aspergillus sclerotioniger CBS 115572]|uniref:Aminoglycoside phosphotransferase domain-containing protein n=1 Tax=Aspergillus sclerotioniger CBS 115572 TaxID=1450535 RepID=A0A317WDC7_9EURO|nr:hypothetical protein BO94DRAFT_557614 [Aspergillus sclerotioniger CBS 115572]PWY83761.1 hypothetical protein BO94DRAFT_557614 [Aspergillus sclerotioniger CBS 115572]